MRIVIGQGSCGIAAGAEKVRKALLNTDINPENISITGCFGMCYLMVFTLIINPINFRIYLWGGII